MEVKKVRVPWYGYVSLLITILLLSGVFQKAGGVLSALDFTNILGQFGEVANTAGEATTFRGTGGMGARDAFVFVLWLTPAVMLAFAIIEVCTNYCGLLAAERLLTPVLKPLLGLTGASALGLVASFTSADAGAGITNSLYKEGYLNDRQRLIFVSFQFSSPALVVNYFSLGAALLPFISVSSSVTLLVIILMKFIGANLCRLYVNKFAKKEDFIRIEEGAAE